MTFELFWDKLVEDDLWWDRIKMQYSDKDHRKIAQDCFIDLLAQPQRWKAQDYSDFRRCFQKWLMNAKPMAVRPQLQQVEEKKPEPEIEISEEEKKRRYQEWYNAVTKVENNFKVPKLTKKQIAEEGDWLPKKTQATYTPDNDVYLFNLKEEILKVAGQKYKGMYQFDGFKNFNLGLVSVFAKSLEDANEIIATAEQNILKV
jgi:hypothetical protein